MAIASTAMDAVVPALLKVGTLEQEQRALLQMSELKYEGMARYQIQDQIRLIEMTETLSAVMAVTVAELLN